MKNEISEQAKDYARHWCNSQLFTKKPSSKPRDGGTPEQRATAVKHRHAIEAHQAKLREKELEL